MSHSTNETQPGFSGDRQQLQQMDEDLFDMNNNDPNNNTEFNDHAETVDEDTDNDGTDMEAVQNQLLKEARTIRSVLNQFSIDEIYSFLEASIDHPQRMQVVMHGFLARDVNTKQAVPPKRRNSGSNSNSPPPTKKEKLKNASGTGIVLESDPSDQSEVYDMSDPSSDDEFSVLEDIVEPEVPEPEVIAIQDAPQPVIPVIEHQVTNDLNTLGEMFPKMSPNVLREMYMQIYPIEAERTLDVLVVQMLDMQDAENNAVVAPALPPAPTPAPTPELPSRNQEEAVAGPSNQAGPSVQAGPSTKAGPNSEPSTSTQQQQQPESGEHVEDSEELSAAVQDQLAYLLGVLPDADPTFLKHKCLELIEKEEAMKIFLADALENKNYPTLDDYKINLQKDETLKKFTGRLSVQEILEVFPEPDKYFKSKVNAGDKEYIERSLAYLKHHFRYVHLNTIKQCLTRTQNLTQAMEDLTREAEFGANSRRKTARTEWECRSPSNAAPLPERPHLHFLQEVAYLEKKKDIEIYFKDREEAKKFEFEDAKARGELLECGCCFDSECVITNMSACPEGHLFCKDCIRRYAENEIGEGRTSFKCLEGACKEEFTLKVLQEVLAPRVFSRLVQKKQLEEVTAANVEGLETCPFCEFGTIPAPGDRIFRCLNQDCMKDSCRLCRELSHIPLRCDEVEHDDEVRARTTIEDRMTEALVRECWKCHKKFVKVDGCNKMTCSCGAKMCYICRQPITDYNHFANVAPGQDLKGKCPLYVNNEELHVRAVTEEAERAKQELLAAKPALKLKHDPTKMLPTTARAHPQGYDARRQQLQAQLEGRLARVAQLMMLNHGANQAHAARAQLNDLNIPGQVQIHRRVARAMQIQYNRELQQELGHHLPPRRPVVQGPQHAPAAAAAQNMQQAGMNINPAPVQIGHQAFQNYYQILGNMRQQAQAAAAATAARRIRQPTIVPGVPHIPPAVLHNPYGEHLRYQVPFDPRALNPQERIMQQHEYNQYNMYHNNNRVGGLQNPMPTPNAHPVANFANYQQPMQIQYNPPPPQYPRGVMPAQVQWRAAQVMVANPVNPHAPNPAVVAAQAQLNRMLAQAAVPPAMQWRGGAQVQQQQQQQQVAAVAPQAQGGPPPPQPRPPQPRPPNGPYYMHHNPH